MLKESKIKKRNVSAWTKIEEQALINLYNDHSNNYIAKVLNKSKASVDQKASVLRLKKSVEYRQKVSRLNNQKKYYAWSQKEIDYLINHYLNDTYNDIAEVLGRTSSAINQKARQLKLKKYFLKNLF